ncbi:MAG: hypothetical protein ACRC67_16610 [Inquilinus sp.]|uniref:hypothetical protein n=1 Tax=Inquilinus sp. TaxID=1932117 RepID=UPI003F33CDC5
MLLEQIAGLTVANASQHLQHLRRAGLVESRRDGRRVPYRLRDGFLDWKAAGMAVAG